MKTYRIEPIAPMDLSEFTDTFIKFNSKNMLHMFQKIWMSHGYLKDLSW